MADAQANIGINLDASDALAQLKNLQRQISVFNSEIARGGAAAAASAANMQKNLINSINATNQFSASLTKVRSSAEFFTNALEKNKFSMGEYFRYAAAASGKFGDRFSKELGTINDVARERVKDLQTQYIKLGKDASGSIQAIKVRPLMLDMESLGTKTQMAVQQQQIFNQLLKQGSTNLVNWGKNTQWAGRQLMVGFTIPLTIFGATAAQEFMKLEEQALRFRRVYGELFTTESETNAALENIRKLAIEFTKYGVAVEKTMSLAADTAAMGKTGAELTAQVAEATRLAVLGAVEQEQALQTTISLTDAFGTSVDELTNKINFLNAVENQTVTSIEDLTIAIPKAGPVIKQLGGDVEDLAFFLTAMREGGINASEGANALKSGLASLINPTEKAAQMLQGFGINIRQIVQSNEGDVSGIVVDFAKALDQLDPLRRAQAIEQLFGKFQFARLSTLFQNVIQDGTQASRVLELAGTSASELAQLSQSELTKLEESPLFQYKAALEEFQAALAPVGESFLRLVTPLIEFGTKVLNVFNNLNDNAKTFILGLVALIGGVGPVFLMTVGLMANGVGNLFKGFLGLNQIMQRLRGETAATGQQVNYMTQEQLEAASIASSLNQLHATLAQTFTSETGAVNNLATAYQRMINVQRSAFGTPMPTAGKTQGFMRGRPVPGYANGVVSVPGPKGKGDVVPAMLAPGEAVIPAAMAEKYGPLINAMIAGTIPGYQQGRKTVGQAKKEAGLYKAPSAVAKQTAEMLWSTLDAETQAVIQAAREVGATQEQINNLLKKQASHIQKDAALLDFNGEIVEVKNWVSKNLLADMGYVNNYMNSLKAGSAVMENFKKQNLDVIARDLGMNMQELINEINLLEQGIHPTTARSASVMQRIAATDASYQGRAAAAGLSARLQGDFYSTIQQRQYKPELDPSAAKTTQARLKRFGNLIGVDAANAVALGVEESTQQKSPSRRAKKSGENIGIGAIQGIDASADEANKAGQNLANQAVQGFNNFPAAGAEAATRAGNRRVTTAGNITPGQPIQYLRNPAMDMAILNNAFSAKIQKAGQSLGTFAEKAIVNANKIGTIGIAASTLAGSLAMIPGPIGDFANKIFPAISAITGLTFALNLLRAETIKTAITTKATAISSTFTEALKGGASNFGALGAVMRSLISPVGLVVAGFALLAGGIALLVKISNDQAKKISGLGDAANISADRLTILNNILGTQLALSGGMGTGGAGLEPETAEGAAAAATTKEQLLASDEFKKEFKGTISAVRDASQEAATQALTSLAITLQTAGAEEEMVAGIVNAILEEAGRTDIKLSFDEISIVDAPAIAEDSVRLLTEAFQENLDSAQFGKILEGYDPTAMGGKGLIELTGGSTVNLATMLGGDVFAQVQSTAGVMAAQIQNATMAFNVGAISAEQYNTQMQQLNQTLTDLANSGQAGLAQAVILAGELARQLNQIPGMEGIQQRVAGLIGAGTATGVSGAMAVMQAEAAGVVVPQADVTAIEAGAKVGASQEEIKVATELTTKINELTEARKKEDEAARSVTTAEQNVDVMDDQVQAIEDQIRAYDEISAKIKNNSKITNKAALVQKIATDENLRAQWATAQLADQQNNNTAATDAFIASVQNQINAQSQLDYQSAITGLQAQAQAEADTKIQTDALTLALGDSQLAQAAMGDAAVATAIAALYAQETLNGAALSAEEFATKVRESGIIELIQSLPSIGARSVGGGGGGGTPTSFLDQITKDLNQFVSSGVDIGKGFDKSLASIQKFSAGTNRSLRGLSGQLRDIGVTEPLIEQILGMEPEEWEKQKRKLFNFDAAGNITGLTEAGKAIQDALNTAEIGKFINEQENITVSVGNQITALNRLTAAGASYQAAYRAVQNTALAAAIATAKSSKEIQAAAQAAMQAQQMMDKFEEINEEEMRKERISEAIREMNREFSDQAKILDYINKNRSKLTEAQISAILENDDLRSLVLEPGIDPGALKTALANANKKAELELKIKKLTVEGQQEIFDEGISAAMSAFSAKEEEIELKFKAKIANEEDIVKTAEEQIAKIEFELDDYQAGLDEIDRQEELINQAYEKRFESLDRIADLNEQITASQRQQLDLSNALSRGDIAAAARAAQELRAREQENALDNQRRMMETAQQTEIAALRSTSGLSREELQAKVRQLEEEIFKIEENSLEPAQERIRLAEVQRDNQISNLEVLGKTREEWERISNEVALAEANGWRFADAMQEALNIMDELINGLLNRPAPAGALAIGEGGGGGGNGGGGGGGSAATSNRSSGNAPQGPRAITTPGQQLVNAINTVRSIQNTARAGSAISVNALEAANRTIRRVAPIVSRTDPATINRLVNRRSGGGIIKKMAMGGIVPKYLANGGILGSDTIPAMLTPGEFVVRRPAVNGFGVDNLEKINNGTYQGNSMYNYNLEINVKSESNPEQIARTVMSSIKQVEGRRLRGNQF